MKYIRRGLLLWIVSQLVFNDFEGYVKCELSDFQGVKNVELNKRVVKPMTVLIQKETITDDHLRQYVYCLEALFVLCQRRAVTVDHVLVQTFVRKSLNSPPFRRIDENSKFANRLRQLNAKMDIFSTKPNQLTNPHMIFFWCHLLVKAATCLNIHKVSIFYFRMIYLGSPIDEKEINELMNMIKICDGAVLFGKTRDLGHDLIKALETVPKSMQRIQMLQTNKDNYVLSSLIMPLKVAAQNIPSAWRPTTPDRNRMVRMAHMPSKEGIIECFETLASIFTPKGVISDSLAHGRESRRV